MYEHVGPKVTSAQGGKDYKDGEFQERCLSRAFKTRKQQMYEHVGPKVTSAQGGKDYKDGETRLCLVDDLKEL
nr:hypothetical protein [Tanacetum cinerariifolium]